MVVFIKSKMSVLQQAALLEPGVLLLTFLGFSKIFKNTVSGILNHSQKLLWNESLLKAMK